MKRNLSHNKLSRAALVKGLAIFVSLLLHSFEIDAQCSSLNQMDPITTNSPVWFQWNDACPAAFNYEIQVLRLYNVDSNLKTSNIIQARLDWSQALVHFTNASASFNGGCTIDYLSLTEGTGYYIWRVRRVTTRDFLGRTDHNMWSNWVGEPLDDILVSVNPTVDAARKDIFWYNQFDDDKNWVHKRSFGNSPYWYTLPPELNEQIEYSNHLLMPIQQQQQIYYNWSGYSRYPIISKTEIDESGRPTVQSLPAPGDVGWLEYQSGWMGAVDNYYSSGNPDNRVPSAEGRPYSTTLYYNDPLNRPREISAPGATHAPTSNHKPAPGNHAIYKFYAKPTDDELIYIFGDEAPKSESVSKTYTTDPNGTVNVTYTDEFDRTIATCITPPNSDLLIEYDGYGEESLKPAFHDTVKQKIEVNPTVLLMKATYAFAVPTTLSYFYEILSRPYQNQCLDICATCDYKITIKAKERDGSAYYEYTHNIVPVEGSYGCGARASQISGTYDIGGTSLQPGTYDISLYLETNNTDPVTGKKYVENVLEDVHKKIDNALGHSFYKLPVAGSPVYKDMDSLWIYARANDLENLAKLLNADTSKSTVSIKIDELCDTLVLPTVRCKRPSCDTPRYAEYMKQQMMAEDAKTGNTYFANAYIDTTTNGLAYTTSLHNLFLLSTDGELNRIIKRMVADGYDCEDLWDAWVQTVQNYIAGQKAMTPGVTQLVSGTPKYDWWQQFMKLVGYKFPFKARQYSELFNATDSVRLKPYRYFPYGWSSDMNSEDVFCRLSGATAPCASSTSTPPTWSTTINNFPLSDPASQVNHMFNFYKMIKNNGVAGSNYVSAASIAGAINPANKNLAQAMATIQAECNKSCDLRKTNLITAISQDYMDRWSIKVEGIPYDPWKPTPVSTVSIASVYCLANSIVEQCKSMCDVTPDSSGYLSAGKIDKIQKAMAGGTQVFTRPVGSPVSCPAGYDSVTIVNTKQHIDVLNWVNYQYRSLLDSLSNAGVSSYSWPVFSKLYSLAMPPVSVPPCSAATVNITNAHINDPNTTSFFSYGKPVFKSGACASPKVKLHRLASDSVHLNTETTVTLSVYIQGSNLAANDSIVVLEKIPAGFTFMNGMGTVNSGYMRYTIIGPRNAGDSILINYTIKSDNVVGNAPFDGVAFKYVSGLPTSDSCRIYDHGIYKASCLSMRFVKVTRTNFSSWIPTDTALCIGVCEANTVCNGRVCINWTQPSFDDINPDTTMRYRTCGELVCANFLQTLNKKVEDLHTKYEDKIMQMYRDSCLNKYRIKDKFVNSYKQLQGQYTLYFYDRAGNLIRTVAPEGANENWGYTRLTKPVNNYRNEYDYDTRGHVLRQSTPDAGETWYVYDKLGRLRFSRNAKQSAGGAWSYTKYDVLDRIIETGEITGYTVTQAGADNMNEPMAGSKGNVNIYVYTTPYTMSPYYNSSAMPPLSIPGAEYQKNITNRLSFTISDKNGNLMPPFDDQAVSVYSYDAHGNITHHYQFVSGMPKARLVAYENDVIGGKIDQIALFNIDGTDNSQETFGLFYYYSQNGRLTEVFAYPNGKSFGYWGNGLHPTSTMHRYIAAGYIYNPHSFTQLRRTELGFNQQGLDYTYTLHGWLKAINHPDSTQDPGLDLPTTYTTPPVFTFRPDGSSPTVAARNDLFSEVLHYYDGDFIHPGSPFHTAGNAMFLQGGELFNGNIKAVQTKTLKHPLSPQYLDGEHTGYVYTYDQLNRLRQADFHSFDRNTNSWNHTAEYDEVFNYDKNGNLKFLNRWAFNAATSSIVKTEDEITFKNVINTNKIASIHDAQAIGYTPALRDLDSGIYFSYDAIGNLTSHHNTQPATPDREDLAITWNPYGKIETITDNANNTTTTFFYDATGNRVRKKEVNNATSAEQSTYYILTGDGRTLATYHGSVSGGGSGFGLSERHLWGHDHLGIIYGINFASDFQEIHYEVKDHLGNTRAVFTDLGGGTGYPAEPEMKSYNNYYAYGSLQPGRFVNSGNYRYGFNGQEKDDNYMGVGNLNTAKYWEYDTRLGRRWNLDPLANADHNIPFSPFSAMANNPIRYTDPDGADWVEGKDGNIRWRSDVTSKNYQKKGVLAEGEIYRGTSYKRERIWNNVNVKGNIENGLMRETYTANAKLQYTNLTPWVDNAFEEMSKNISETGHNSEITKYWAYTQIFDAAAGGDKWAQSVLNEDQTPWCAAFVNFNLEKSGIDGTNSALAFSFKKYGQDLGRDMPVYGSIAVMNYSHVGIVVGANKDGRIILLGGNQGNAVNLSPNAQSSVFKYVYPNGYNATNLSLPIYNLKGRSLSNATSR